jgi:hypothetical protein
MVVVVVEVLIVVGVLMVGVVVMVIVVALVVVMVAGVVIVVVAMIPKTVPNSASLRVVLVVKGKEQVYCEKAHTQPNLLCRRLVRQSQNCRLRCLQTRSSQTEKVRVFSGSMCGADETLT